MTRPPAIGAASAAALEHLRATVSEFEALDLPEAQPVFHRILEQAGQASLRISVVGQVKAGKSSLINAMTGLEDFLPTEVNPWTAVITNLHFGKPGRTHLSGEFEFFSEQEWARMLEGGSESRKLAERYLPGFQSEVLARQIVEMQDKARARLGEMYRLLLGKTHRFNTVTPEVLERYVSAGHVRRDAVDGAGAGRFSGICKSAEIHLDPGPFQVPTTISDTPGINDPFLVRDEITTSSFRLADIFVVTLSAHQVLNPADIALLKMLSHHQRQTVIVFVNRIDELDDPAADAPRLLASLSGRLTQEIGQHGDILLAGSAHWAHVAVAGTDAEVAAAVADPVCAAYARMMGVADMGDAREMLLEVSGLAALARELTRLGHDGKTADVVAEAVSDGLGGLEFLRQAMQEKLAADEAALQAGDAAGLAEAETARIAARLSELAALTRSLAGAAKECRVRLREACAQTSDGVMRAIGIALDGFIEEQTAGFRAALAADGAGSAWKFDTLALQEKARTHVLESYRAGRHELDRLLESYARDLDDTLSASVGGLPVNRILQGLPNGDVLPGFAPRSNLVEVELGAARGWKFWKSRRIPEDEAVARIAEVIRAEMQPALGALEGGVEEALAARNAAATDRLYALLDHAKWLIEAEIDELERDGSFVSGGLDDAAMARLVEERARRAERLRERISLIESACIGLARTLPEPALPEPAPERAGHGV
ncbi:dynamin family protein [Rhodovulum sp. DZ06]|uniref:dynamin family protein n=1 Tax=Rhodovulum sp. DZ06 TaxID=3425126 RepID=UPI003D343262